MKQKTKLINRLMDTTNEKRILFLGELNLHIHNI